MYIQNYEQLDGACKEQAEFLGHIGKAILSLAWHPEVTNPHRAGLIQTFRMGLMDLSQKTGRPIEVSDVRGEVWINIRERKPITKEMLEAVFSAKPTQELKIKDRIQSQWRW